MTMPNASCCCHIHMFIFRIPSFALSKYFRLWRFFCTRHDQTRIKFLAIYCLIFTCIFTTQIILEPIEALPYHNSCNIEVSCARWGYLVEWIERHLLMLKVLGSNHSPSLLTSQCFPVMLGTPLTSSGMLDGRGRVNQK